MAYRPCPQELPEGLASIPLEIERGTMSAAAALSKVLAFLRSEPKHDAALALYRELSEREYRARHSSLAHSHLPPEHTDLSSGAPRELED